MSAVFFDEPGIRKPDLSLGVGSGSHAVQTAKVMIGIDEVIDMRRPDVVLVAVMRPCRKGSTGFSPIG
jgi:UDP-N-acetylglucosamine 2-epimerase